MALNKHTKGQRATSQNCCKVPTHPRVLPCVCRYMAIIHPLQQRLTSTETRVVMAVIWMLALLLAFPQYYYSDTALLPGRTVCYIDWPEYSTVDFKKMWVVWRGSTGVQMLLVKRGGGRPASKIFPEGIFQFVQKGPSWGWGALSVWIILSSAQVLLEMYCCWKRKNCLIYEYCCCISAGFFSLY